MRIIAGTHKGRRLKAPKWPGLRPTSDKLRETLFNIIAARVPQARVLDVFAGSGAIGLEALSRGASRAVFVEHDRRAVQLIEENATLCGVRERCVIIRDAAGRALQNPIDGDPFDLVMLDPPYDFDALPEVIDTAARHLAPGGLLILEHAARRPPPAVTAAHAVRTVRSGDSALTLFEVR
ncbi:MAG: 16S rRNA (guanine(966)-N(2))-methyltransferase RsmD [Vicinamibacterales bacterium]